jgi:hypothetical protein
MRYRKLSIMACCVAVGIGSASQGQPAPDTSDDQAKALEALHQAEQAQPTTPPAKPKKKRAKKVKKPAAVAPAAPVAVAPATPAAATASSPDDDARALEALRQAEHPQPPPAVLRPSRRLPRPS